MPFRGTTVSYMGVQGVYNITMWYTIDIEWIVRTTINQLILRHGCSVSITRCFCGYDLMEFDLHVHMQSVPITTTFSWPRWHGSWI